MTFRCYKLVKVSETYFPKRTQNPALGVSNENDKTHYPCHRNSPDRSLYVLLAVDCTVSQLYTDFQSSVVQGLPE
jgi:hypothetical protein